jgi:hypothetical protein
VFVDSSSIRFVDPSGTTIEPGDGSVFDPKANRYYVLGSPPARIVNPETSIVWTGRELLLPGNLAPPAPGGIGSPGEPAGGLGLGP